MYFGLLGFKGNPKEQMEVTGYFRRCLFAMKVTKTRSSQCHVVLSLGVWTPQVSSFLSIGVSHVPSVFFVLELFAG